MTRIIPLILALVLMGCGFTPQGEAFRAGVAVKGAQAYDEGLENALWFICQAASHGSVERKFGRTQEMADAYNKLCDYIGDSTTLQAD